MSLAPATAQAHWHRHGYVSVGLGVWPGSYYYGYPYDPYYPYYPYNSYYPYYANSPYYEPAYTVVSSPSFQPVVVNGVTYYLNNGVYYMYTQNGYQAVAAPAGAVTTQVTSTVGPATMVSDDSITVNIPNSKGGYTAVVLKKSGKGYTGPQGEFYADFPKVSQLQVMYGK